MDLKDIEQIITERLKGTQTLTQAVANGLFNQLKGIINPMGLRVSYNFDPKNEALRFIFNVNDKFVNYGIPLTRIARGLVIAILPNSSINSVEEGKGFHAKTLCVPLKEAADCRDFKTLFQEQAHYDVYPLLDGTSITFYHDPAYGWRWGTHHSFDTQTTNWRGYNYKDLFENLVPEFSFQNLNKDCNYHIRMKHPSIHPYMPNTAFVFHLGTYDLTQNKFVSVDIGLRKQKKVELDLKEQGLGYIFRAITTNNSENSSDNSESSDAVERMDFKYETDHRRDVVYMLYKVPMIKNPIKKKEFINYFNMKDFFILNNFLKVEHQRKKFFNIFKQYQGKADYYDKVITEVVSQLGNNFPELKNKEEAMSKEENQIRNIAKKITKTLAPKIKVMYSAPSSSSSLSGTERNGGDKTLRDLVMDPQNTMVIYNAIYANKEQLPPVLEA